MLPALPVDSALPRIVDALTRHRAAVLVASPGAGKTTRVPPALVDRGRVLLLQPRRVAARAMARRIGAKKTVEVKGASHVVMISRPGVTAKFILRAAKSVG